MRHEDVREYYGKTLTGTADLKTNACCTPKAVPDHLKSILAKIHPEVDARYYGCGLIAPQALEGCRVLDLGSGSGRDVYALSALVGATGYVEGVDMTPEQLEVARAHRQYHATAYGYGGPNTDFHEGLIEDLAALDLPRASYDVIVSNCVLNLAMDKAAVLRGVFDLLKPGGEFYFSDVYATRRIPAALRADPVLYGECLSGALYWNDFLTLAKAAGFADPRLVEDRPLTVDNAALEAKLGQIRFHSATYRLFKLEGLEPACEDYGQALIYKGTLAEAGDRFVLDAHHVIEAGRVFPVCGNTWKMLAGSRFAPHFEFIGDFSCHYGLFEGCGTTMPFRAATDAGPSSSSSCC